MSSRFPHRISQLDLDRLHRAKDILLQDLENSLSLLELAHQVGLNDYKLKAGFRQIFGTTVFGYLHQQRMCRAYELLTSGNLNSDKPVHEFPRQLDIATANVYGLAILSAGLFLFLSNCLIHLRKHFGSQNRQSQQGKQPKPQLIGVIWQGSGNRQQI